MRFRQRVTALIALAVLSGCASPEEEQSAGKTFDLGQIWQNVIPSQEPLIRIQLAAEARAIALEGSTLEHFELTPPAHFVEAALIWSLADDGVATLEEIQRHADELDADQRSRLIMVFDQSYERQTGRTLSEARGVLQTLNGWHQVSAEQQCGTALLCLDEAASTDLSGRGVSVRLSEERARWFGAPLTEPIQITESVTFTNPALALTLPFPSVRELASQVPDLGMASGDTMQQIDARVHRLFSRAGFPNHADFAGESSRMIYVSQAERINPADAAPFAGTLRWSEEPLRCQWATIREWFACVFGGNYTEIHMRIFVFAFTDQMTFTPTAPEDTRTLMSMGRFGPRSSPPTGPSPPSHAMHVFVYEVFAEGGTQPNEQGVVEPQFRIRPGTRPVSDHLRLARFMEDRP